MSNIYTRKFIYSKQQYDDITTIETSNGGAKPVFGTVIVNGAPKVYTDIISESSTSKYADARTLITGDIRTIKYTEKK